MSPRRFGIPRLQELSFLEAAMQGVVAGETFEEVRRRLVDHMRGLRAGESGTGNLATFRLALENPVRYVSNTTEALAELMRLGFVERTPLPSSGQAAQAYRARRFVATDDGSAWLTELDQDARQGYDTLLDRLWNAHPQLQGYMRALLRGRFVLPLISWNELEEPRDRRRYVTALVRHVATTLDAEDFGWSASEVEVREAVVSYINERMEAAHRRNRPEPYPRNRDFMAACEEALVRQAFSAIGVPVDYITLEILRRWCRTLGIANFSYHIPGPGGLRLWATAELASEEPRVVFVRRIGDDIVPHVLRAMPGAYEAVRAERPGGTPWVPIHRVRAATCWKVRVGSPVFDRAFIKFLRGEAGESWPFEANLDPAQYGNVPPSELPLQVQTPSGARNYYSMSLVPRRERKTS